jgi:hypothetical protein
MITYDLIVHLDSYIGHPYWPEMARLVDIVKQSGMSRARSQANARKALEEHLKAQGMTLEDYEALKAAAERPFYTVDGPGSAIVVPELHVISMIVAVCDTIRAAGRPVPPDQVRSVIQVSPWTTDRRESDGVWERFAVVSSGTGAKLSNQRGFRSNPYIKGAQATGTISVQPDMVKPEVLRNALEWGGLHIGIGASRKMGWGRFQVVSFKT